MLHSRAPLLAAGVLPNAPSSGATIDGGPGLVIIGIILGAVCGLIFGLISSQIIRFVAFMMGRDISGNGWTVASTLLGAVMFTWMLLAGND